MGKALIFSAPSGSGKTTIVKHLLSKFPQLEFSVSATTRLPRNNSEKNGKDYYFLSVDEFQQKIENMEFVEWEEVYKDIFYGTLKSEVDRIWENNQVVIFDVDVVGGVNLKKYFGKDALSFFVKVPSLEVLEQRLRKRGTENEESLKKRIAKAGEELKFESKFDCTIVNDDLEKAIEFSIEQIEFFIRH